MKQKKAALWSASCLSLALMIAPAAAHAQADASVEETDGTENPDGAITVTGSRLGTSQFNTPDPISIIDPETAKKEGRFDIASTLQSSPIAAGSTQITSAISSNFVTNGGPGAQTIDLRGLGPNRTLVLLNGRRAGPAGTRGGVSSFDLNVLPQSIAERIDILKTGASSIYGSDAIAGVVNIMTKKDIDGLEMNMNVGIPQEGGGEEYRINATWGKSWDRGHFLIAGDYSHTNELARGDRSYLACPAANIYDRDGNRSDLIDPRTGQYHCEDLRWGHVWTYNLIDNMYLPDGTQTSPGGRTVLLQYQYAGENLGIPGYGDPSYAGDFGTPAGWYPTGYDAASMAVQNAYHPFVEQQTIIPKTDLYTIYADAAYEVTDGVELFGEFLFNRRETYQNGWRQFWNFGYTGDLYGTGAGNAWNYWADGWQGINYLSPTAITDHSDSSQRVDYYRGVAGLRGDFGSFNDKTWHYEVYGQYSRSIGRYRNEQILQEAYNVGYYQGFGYMGSCEGMTMPISGAQCVDIPWTDPSFLAGNITDEQAAMLFMWEEGRTLYTQMTGEATVSGELIDLPAGPIGMAIGITARQDKINDTPGELTRSGEAWGTSTAGITAGKSLTSEAFAELSIPLLADMPFFDALTLSAAGRLTNVKATRASDGESASDNGNFTYKIGLNWAVNNWLRFRGSYSTSFRAPALYELFLADQTSFARQSSIDVCSGWGAALAAGTISQRIADNCAADGLSPTYQAGSITSTVYSSGGLGILESETSSTKTVGLVLTPYLSFLPDTQLSLAVDYFDIKVSGEVDQLGAAQIVYGCYNSEDFANEPLCQQFQRSTAATTLDQITDVYDQYINISSQRNKGIDLSAKIRHDFGNAGYLSLTADMTWQTKDNYQLLPTSVPESTNGEAGSPKWVGDFRANWVHPSGFSAFWGVNVLGGTSNVADFVEDFGDTCIDSYNSATGAPIYGTYCPDLTVPTMFYHNVSVSQEIEDGKFTITAGVNNLFNTRPPRVSTLNGSQISMLGPVIAASQYSLVGRKFFLNISAKY